MLHPVDRQARLAELHRIWRDKGSALPQDALRGLLGHAAAWSAWPLVHAAGTRLATRAGLDTAETLHLVDACRALGKGGEALALARVLAREQPQLAELVAELRAWLAWRRHFPASAGSGPLSLEPLAHHHARDFAWQYGDPAIAELCCLPVFADALDWHGWLAERWREGRRLLYAVLHREWGFIGCVSLTLDHGLGFFYYWLGKDFQGQGFGPRAGELLLELGQRAYGLRGCYAKAFDYNLRSRRGLEKMGFAEIGMRGAGDDCDQVFYRRGPPQGRRRTIDELHRLLDSMDASVRPAPASLPGHADAPTV